MTLVDCYPIGVMRMIDNDSEDEKIIAIAKTDPYLNEFHDISEIQNQIQQKLCIFLRCTNN